MKRSIRFKIMLSVMVSVAIAFLVSGVGASAYFYQVLEQHTVLEEQQKQKQISRQIQYIQNNIMAMAKQIVVDDQVQQCLRNGQGEDIIDNLLEAASIKEVLRRYINQQSYVYGVTILGSDGRCFSSNSTEESEQTIGEAWYQNFKESGRGDGFSDAHMYMLEQGNGTMQAISYVMSFRNLADSQEVLGDVIIHISCNYLQKYAGLDSMLLQGYALYDSYGNTLTQSGNITISYDEINRLASELEVLSNKDTLLLDRDMSDNWIFVSEVSKRLLTKQLKFVGFFFLGIFVCVAVFLILVLFFIVKNITRPIEQLHTVACEISRGNLDVRVDIHTNDELAILGDSFNTMTDDIQEMMQKSIDYEKTTKEMEINRLMLQINPHFIYNTLNSIVYMARISGNTDIVRFSNAFISLLQDTLHVTKDSIFITIEQEIKNVKNYLLLQEYRYPDRFEVTYDLDDHARGAQIPNVLIQPLVENAVFHGLAAKLEKGHLKIKVLRKQEDIEISICDDGVGMSKETVEKIQQEEDPIKGEMRTIGVGNVRQRIRHIYGENYGMQIDSELNKGTDVTIKIPYRKYEETKEGEKL